MKFEVTAMKVQFVFKLKIEKEYSTLAKLDNPFTRDGISGQLVDIQFAPASWITRERMTAAKPGFYPYVHPFGLVIEEHYRMVAVVSFVQWPKDQPCSRLSARRDQGFRLIRVSCICRR